MNRYRTTSTLRWYDHAALWIAAASLGWMLAAGLDAELVMRVGW